MTDGSTKRRWLPAAARLGACGLAAAICANSAAVDMKDAEAAAAAGNHEYAVVIAKDLAANGDPRAALFLANAHLNATGVEGDLNQAVKWFFKAGDKGEKEALHTLSLLRRKANQSPTADAVAQAIRAAFANYRNQEIAAEFEELPEGAEGDSTGARLFKSGRKEEAMAVLLREARALDPAALIYLRIFYFNKVEGVPERDPRILAFFRQAAEEGDEKSREILGRILMEGTGAPKDEEKGMEMLADATTDESRKLLVKAYLDRGWEEKAAAVYREAAKAGSAWGNFEYAKLLLRDGLNAEAIPYLDRTVAAEPENWPATIKLGKALIEAPGAARDTKRGFALYRRAAEKGDDAVSQYVLGLLYLRGVGAPPSKEQAVTWFAKAAERGVTQARVELDKLTVSTRPRIAAADADVPMDMGAEEGSTAPSPAPSPAPKPKFHVVAEGDTFYGITLEYGISYLALRRANPGVNEAKLRLGQKIRLPGK